MKNSILWFKNDLRINDNESLSKASAQSNLILPVYIFDPRHWEQKNFPFAKAGYNRFMFLSDTLLDLREHLKALGTDLLIKCGKAEVILPQLITQYKIDTVFAEQEYAYEELYVLQEVKKGFQSTTKLILSWGKTLYHIDDIPYKIPEIPLTSKAFRINTTKTTEVRELFKPPRSIESPQILNWGKLPSYKDLGIIKSEVYKEEPFLRGGESYALERLTYYTKETELLTSYKWTRNKSEGMDYSSKLSAYLALGAISPRTIYKAIKQYEKHVKKNISTWWLLFEVIWRDYFTFKGMRMGTAIFKTEGFRQKDITFTNTTNYFERWCEGTTGIPFIDAHMRQLNKTGYMSNRGRVNCASYLIHDLKIDWTWGAQYFESKLIDYDVSANWMNWHVQAFEIWYTNPVNQSLKYKAASYIKKWVPELSGVPNELIYIPWEIDNGIKSYPPPIAVYSKWNRAVNKIKTQALA